MILDATHDASYISGRRKRTHRAHVCPHTPHTLHAHAHTHTQTQYGRRDDHAMNELVVVE